MFNKDESLSLRGEMVRGFRMIDNCLCKDDKGVL